MREYFGVFMKTNYQSFPKYPCDADVWDILAAESRPIVVYGMGNGADKLLSRFEAYNIEVADFFASDDFVRGQTFHGKKVLTLRQVEEKYEDFIFRS